MTAPSALNLTSVVALIFGLGFVAFSLISLYGAWRMRELPLIERLRMWLATFYCAAMGGVFIALAIVVGRAA